MRARTRLCTRCGERLAPDARQCGECGWALRAAKPAADPRHGKQPCDFRAGPRACPLVGTIAHGGLMLCPPHFSYRDDPATGARVIDDIDRHGPPRGQDWREALVQAHIAKHDLVRRAGETLPAFRRRCMASAIGHPNPPAANPPANRARRIDALVERFTERLAICAADGLDADQAMRKAVAAHAEELLPD